MHKSLKIVGGSLLAAWMALNQGYALEQKNMEGPVSIPQPNHESLFGKNPSTLTREQLETVKQQDIDPSVPWTEKYAFRASTNRIVLHYGKGILDVDLLAEGLSEQGYPTIAVPGGPEGQVEMFLDRKIPGKYTQHDLVSGTLGGDAVLFFDKYVRKTPDPNALSIGK